MSLHLELSVYLEIKFCHFAGACENLGHLHPHPQPGAARVTLLAALCVVTPCRAAWCTHCPLVLAHFGKQSGGGDEKLSKYQSPFTKQFHTLKFKISMRAESGIRAFTLAFLENHTRKNVNVC